VVPVYIHKSLPTKRLFTHIRILYILPPQLLYKKHLRVTKTKTVASHSFISDTSTPFPYSVSLFNRAAYITRTQFTAFDPGPSRNLIEHDVSDSATVVATTCGTNFILPRCNITLSRETRYVMLLLNHNDRNAFVPRYFCL